MNRHLQHLPAESDPERPAFQSEVVYLIDDDASVLLATSRMLRASGFTVKAFASPNDFFREALPDVPSCIVLDLNMPRISGLQLQTRLLQEGNPIPIIFLTGQGDIPTTVEAMRRGAEDFLTKTAPKEKLLQAVRRAILKDQTRRRERDSLAELRARFERLSPREREVLGHVLRGRLNKQVAADLGIDERSVKRHRTSFMGKLGVSSVAELVQLANTARVQL